MRGWFGKAGVEEIVLDRGRPLRRCRYPSAHPELTPFVSARFAFLE
jgi:hypothetical protein